MTFQRFFCNFNLFFQSLVPVPVLINRTALPVRQTVFLRNLPHHSARRPEGHRMGRNIVGYHTAGSDHHIVSDRHNIFLSCKDIISVLNTSSPMWIGREN